MERYKKAKKEANLALIVAKTAIFGRLYEEPKDKGGDKKLYRLVKTTERKARDLDKEKCVKDEEGRVLVEEAYIRHRWMKKMPKVWRWSTMIPLNKKKGDIKNCNNYRGIKLMSHTMKVWEGEEECIYFLKSFQIHARVFVYGSHSPCKEGGRVVYERKRDLHTVFIDLEKAYGKVPREDLWRCLDARSVLVAYTTVIKEMLSRNKIEYLECNFSDRTDEEDVNVMLHTQVILERYSFKNPGSIIQGNGEIDGDVSHRIGAGWVKWRHTYSVLCDKNVHLNLKNMAPRKKAKSSQRENTTPRVVVNAVPDATSVHMKSESAPSTSAPPTYSTPFEIPA
ncbi:uncharacterized protein [Nicotiana tomentosiformis]|uniref:uncharacterized protein n=1 Tax=Nicotiana tomentosiformis TaxID=4098 RepID=UPI00388C4F81